MAKCGACGAEVTHVRDDYTGGTFPVDADPVIRNGYTLSAPKEGERNQRAQFHTSSLYQPHNLTCDRSLVAEATEEA